MIYLVTMGRKGKEVSDDVRVCVCTMFRNGRKVVEISRDMDLKRTTVSTIVNVFKKTGRMKKLPRGGRPEKLTQRDQRRLTRLIMTNRRTPLKKILAEFNAENDFVKLTHSGLQITLRRVRSGMVYRLVAGNAEHDSFVCVIVTRESFTAVNSRHISLFLLCSVWRQGGVRSIYTKLQTRLRHLN